MLIWSGEKTNVTDPASRGSDEHGKLSDVES